MWTMSSQHLPQGQPTVQFSHCDLMVTHLGVSQRHSLCLTVYKGTAHLDNDHTVDASSQNIALSASQMICVIEGPELCSWPYIPFGFGCCISCLTSDSCVPGPSQPRGFHSVTSPVWLPSQLKQHVTVLLTIVISLTYCFTDSALFPVTNHSQRVANGKLQKETSHLLEVVLHVLWRWLRG